ncbi:hypothetical protein BH10ACT7_BH10ACT7_07300 [soil metagenome]
MTDTSDLPWIGRPARSALEHVGILTLDQVAEHTWDEIADLHGVGPKAVGILKAALNEREHS